MPSTRASRGTFGLIAAFAAVYVIWGSTYLAILFAIESIPPFFALGTRFAAAGLALYTWLKIRGNAHAGIREIAHAAVVGALTVGAGTGTVAWAEQYLYSGVVALIVTSVPIWMVLLDWKWLGGGAPAPQVMAGLVLGLAGIVVLIGPEFLEEGLRGHGLAAIVVLCGSISWSVGSLHSKRVPMPSSPLVSSAIQMLGGAALLIFASAVSGEFGRIDVQAVSLESLAGWAYLVVFGSIIAFSAYVWLLGKASPKQVSSYAYVNPVVAVFLGWLIADEVVNTRILVAVAILVLAVALIVRFGRARGNGLRQPVNAKKRQPAVTTSPDRRCSSRKSYSESDAGEAASVAR